MTNAGPEELNAAGQQIQAVLVNWYGPTAKLGTDTSKSICKKPRLNVTGSGLRVKPVVWALLGFN